jgi:hypothetical protein
MMVMSEEVTELDRHYEMRNADTSRYQWLGQRHNLAVGCHYGVDTHSLRFYYGDLVDSQTSWCTYLINSITLYIRHANVSFLNVSI